MRQIKDLSSWYSRKTGRQRNVLRLAAVLLCAIPVIGWFLILPWMLPLVLYLEFHLGSTNTSVNKNNRMLASGSVFSWAQTENVGTLVSPNLDTKAELRGIPSKDISEKVLRILFEGVGVPDKNVGDEFYALWEVKKRPGKLAVIKDTEFCSMESEYYSDVKAALLIATTQIPTDWLDQIIKPSGKVGLYFTVQVWSI